MLKQLHFKKEYWLACGIIVLLLLSYQLAFKKTIEAWQSNRNLNRQLARFADISSEPQYQERKNKNLSSTINLYKTDTTEFRSNVIVVITRIAEKEHVKLVEVPTRDPLFYSSEFMILKLKLEGDYFSLTKVFDLLNRVKGIGVVRSATYRSASITSGNRKEERLMLELYFIILNK